MRVLDLRYRKGGEWGRTDLDHVRMITSNACFSDSTSSSRYSSILTSNIWYLKPHQHTHIIKQ